MPQDLPLRHMRFSKASQWPFVRGSFTARPLDSGLLPSYKDIAREAEGDDLSYFVRLSQFLRGTPARLTL